MTHPLFSSGLWFDRNAEEAVAFYCSVFPNSEILTTMYYGSEGQEIHGGEPGSVVAINFRLDGCVFQAINGGPVFQKNPSISFMILCTDVAEADRFWNALSEGGEVLMAIDKYDWSERYGWLNDKYGTSWQIYTGNGDGLSQKVSPSLLFTGNQFGRAEEAIRFYTSIFPDPEIQGILKFPEGTPDAGKVMHSQFKMAGQIFMAMDSGENHPFRFNEGVSLIVNCQTQEELDNYWGQLLVGGGTIQECGWLKDRFGVSWQVVPVQLDQMLADTNEERRDRVMKAMLGMKKLDLAKLQEAYGE
jgi:predicted 3-demethylubiquinone-9 3-methyltransferase (glyoxalase superfamily)